MFHPLHIRRQTPQSLEQQKCHDMRGGEVHLHPNCCNLWGDKPFAKRTRKALAAYSCGASFSCLIRVEKRSKHESHSFTSIEQLFSSFVAMKKIWAWVTHLWVGVAQTPPWLAKYNTKCLNKRQKWCHLPFVSRQGCFLAEFWGDAEMRIHCKAVYFAFSTAQELNWKYFSNRWCAGPIGHYCKSNLTINPIYLISQSHLKLRFTITNVANFKLIFNWERPAQATFNWHQIQKNTNCPVSCLWCNLYIWCISTCNLCFNSLELLLT